MCPTKCGRLARLIPSEIQFCVQNRKPRCWGAVPLPDGGFAMSCGVGIENCPATLSSADLPNCKAGKGDLRAGAYPREAGNWASLVIRVDAVGTLRWMRTDLGGIVFVRTCFIRMENWATLDMCSSSAVNHVH